MIRAAATLLALALAACTPSPDNGYDEDRPQYIVSSQAVSVSGVELTFESCSLPQQCDLVVQIANKSERCVAFNQISLPVGAEAFLDTTFNLPRRIIAQPDEQIRYAFVILQPGDTFREAVDLTAIYDVADLSGQSVIFRTDFIECATFTGAPAESFELVSAPITFERAP